ncbi:MAG: CsgG/HfaB family protein, partial [Spirochaetales bacterium]|nr:CsgG/HfaB family protein [Spirochaetales bacterium]
MKAKQITLKALLILLLLPNLSPQSTERKITLALMDFENMDEADDFDYMGSLALALIKEDLSHDENILLVDRRRLNTLLEEQKLQLTGIMDGETTVEIGKLLGCDYLCGGNFVVLKEEVLLDITLTEVETGRVLSFSTRGDSEDLFHRAAETLVKELTGETVLFRTANTGRPILKHIPKEPGTLKFYSYLIDARIYLDDQFYGYTTGDMTVPNLIELPPGEHTIMVDLGPNFGVVIEPEITFEKWRHTFQIESYQTLVLEDKTTHFNDRLYDLRNLIWEDEDFYGDRPQTHEGERIPYAFADRQGQPVEGTLTVNLTWDEKGNLTAHIIL